MSQTISEESQAAFIRWELASRDSIEVKRIYVDIVEDLVGGVLLSQIVYWFLPDRHGKSKLSVYADNKYWLAKAREEWWNECRVSVKQFDRVVSELVALDLIEVRVMRFNGCPTKHIHLSLSNLITEIKRKMSQNENLSGNHGSVIAQRANSNLPKGEDGTSLLSNFDLPLSGRTANKGTETTAETTVPSLREGAEVIWKNYPRKEDKKEGILAILKALKSRPFDYLLAKVKAYSKAVEQWPEHTKCYVPYGRKWFNKFRFDDDESTWVRKDDTPPTKKIPILQERIDQHPANRESAYFDQRKATPEKIQELKTLVKDLSALKRTVTSPG